MSENGCNTLGELANTFPLPVFESLIVQRACDASCLPVEHSLAVPLAPPHGSSATLIISLIQLQGTFSQLRIASSTSELY